VLTILCPDVEGAACISSGICVPQHDSQLLIEAMTVVGAVKGRRVLDFCTGSGVVAIAAARLGARTVTAFDVCPHAIGSTKDNAADAGVCIDARVGTCSDASAAGPFDVVVSNPPYVPTGPNAHLEEIPIGVGPATAWNAGIDGRLVLNPLCDHAAELLTGGGTMLIVQSELADTKQSLRRLRSAGLRADVVLNQLIPFGPVLRARAEWMESTGMLPVGRREEEIVVIHAEKR
jgi:release factor glutamine methyltransferase